MSDNDEELHEKLKRAFGEDAAEGAEHEEIKFAAVDMPDTSDLDARLRAVASKTDVYKQKTEQSAEDVAKRRKTERADARSLGMGLQIAYTIIGFPILGFGVGALVDVMTKANIWKGFLGMGGCVLAVVAAIMLINRANTDN